MTTFTEFFISSAHAEGAAAAGAEPNAFMQFLPLFTLLVIFYFLILRPQQKRAKDQKAMLEALQKGDEVVTVGGELGRIVKVGDTILSLEVAENVVVQVQRASIQTVLPKGTIKSAN